MGVLTYETLEVIRVRRPVDRVAYMAGLCRDQVVLDLGCYDETALVKVGTTHWLHGRISSVASRVDGVDMSARIPSDGLRTSSNSVIYKGDAVSLEGVLGVSDDYDVVVAGEFIEHIEAPLAFFKNLRRRFPGRTFIFSTPNGASISSLLMGLIGREAQHPDHLASFSYKIINTLCARAGFKSWEIVPYHFYATEMLLKSKGLRRVFVLVVEKAIRLFEFLFPLTSFGYVVRVVL